jgi:hypothetical protein
MGQTGMLLFAGGVVLAITATIALFAVAVWRCRAAASSGAERRDLTPPVAVHEHAPSAPARHAAAASTARRAAAESGARRGEATGVDVIVDD